MASVQKARTSVGEWRWVVRWRVEGSSRERWFVRSKDAQTFRRQVEAAELQGISLDPARGSMHFAAYAERWLTSRSKPDGRPLAPRTKELYRSLLDLHVLPELGRAQLSGVNAERIRTWHGRVAHEASPLQAAKAYRVVRTIFGTAVDDGRIPSDPCRLRGAGVERSAERPFVDAEMVASLAEAIEPRYKALVLLAGFGGLRLGELLAVRARDVDLQHHVVRVEAQAVELKDGTRIVTPPKTEAGRRIVHLSILVVESLAWHLKTFPPSHNESVVFTGPLSDGLRRVTLQKAWDKARKAAGFPTLHLHDLRHAAGTLAAQTGATTREVMARLGHASPAAAQRYQHAAERRDAVIASALDIVLGTLPRFKSDAPTDETQDALWGWCGVGNKAPLATEPHTPLD